MYNGAWASCFCEEIWGGLQMMFAEINPAYLVATLFFITGGCYLYLCALLCIGNIHTQLLRNYLIVGMHLAVVSLCYGLMTIAENETLLRLS